MKLKEIKYLPYKVYLSSKNGCGTFSKDFDRNRYSECKCEWVDWEDDDGADENGCTIIRKGVDLIIYDN